MSLRFCPSIFFGAFFTHANGGLDFLFADFYAFADFAVQQVNGGFGLIDGVLAAFDVYLVAERADFDVQDFLNQAQIGVRGTDQLLNKLVVIEFKNLLQPWSSPLFRLCSDRFTAERVGRCFGYSDVDYFVQFFLIQFSVQVLHVRGAADELACMSASGFKQNRHYFYPDILY